MVSTLKEQRISPGLLQSNYKQNNNSAGTEWRRHKERHFSRHFKTSRHRH